MPAIIVTLPDDHDHPGEHDGVLPAWAVDDETGDWRGMAQYCDGVGPFLGWIPATQLRRNGDLADDDGPVDDNMVPLLQSDT